MQLTVGEKIKKYRIEKGMTQEELGKELGVGKAAVQKYESNQVQNLKSAHIKKMCALFNRVPWDFIFDGEFKNGSNNDMDKAETIRKMFGDDGVEILMPMMEFNEKGIKKGLRIHKRHIQN